MEQVSKEMMVELIDLKRNFKQQDFRTIFWLMDEIPEYSNLLECLSLLENTVKFEQAIIDYVVWDKDVFEVEKPKKWVVRAPDTVSGNGITLEWYLCRNDWNPSDPYSVHCMGKGAEKKYKDKVIVKFDTKEEAMEYVNPQTEAVEVEE